MANSFVTKHAMDKRIIALESILRTIRLSVKLMAHFVPEPCEGHFDPVTSKWQLIRHVISADHVHQCELSGTFLSRSNDRHVTKGRDDRTDRQRDERTTAINP